MLYFNTVANCGSFGFLYKMLKIGMCGKQEKYVNLL